MWPHHWHRHGIGNPCTSAKRQQSTVLQLANPRDPRVLFCRVDKCYGRPPRLRAVRRTLNIRGLRQLRVELCDVAPDSPQNRSIAKNGLRSALADLHVLRTKRIPGHFLPRLSLIGRTQVKEVLIELAEVPFIGGPILGTRRVGPACPGLHFGRRRRTTFNRPRRFHKRDHQAFVFGHDPGADPAREAWLLRRMVNRLALKTMRLPLGILRACLRRACSPPEQQGLLTSPTKISWFASLAFHIAAFGHANICTQRLLTRLNALLSTTETCPSPHSRPDHTGRDCPRGQTCKSFRQRLENRVGSSASGTDR